MQDTLLPLWFDDCGTVRPKDPKLEVLLVITKENLRRWTYNHS
jgi:hypothetical protein